jgi:hypothetical protein
MLAIHTSSLDSLNAGYAAQVTVANGTTSVAVRVPSALQIAASACGDRGYGNGGITWEDSESPTIPRPRLLEP